MSTNSSQFQRQLRLAESRTHTELDNGKVQQGLTAQAMPVLELLQIFDDKGSMIAAGFAIDPCAMYPIWHRDSEVNLPTSHKQ